MLIHSKGALCGGGDGRPSSPAGPGRSQLSCQRSGRPTSPPLKAEPRVAAEPRGRGAGGAAATPGLWRGQSIDQAGRDREGRGPPPATTDRIDRTRLGGLRHGVWAPTHEAPDIQVFFENRGRKSTVVLKLKKRDKPEARRPGGGRGPRQERGSSGTRTPVLHSVSHPRTGGGGRSESPRAWWVTRRLTRTLGWVQGLWRPRS